MDISKLEKDGDSGRIGDGIVGSMSESGSGESCCVEVDVEGVM